MTNIKREEGVQVGLRIVRDRLDSTYLINEQITGNIEVQVFEDCECTELTIRISWESHGRGKLQGGTGATTILFSGEWRRGDEVTYPFSLNAPAGPTSVFHGTRRKRRHVDSYLVAYAVLGDSRRIEAKETIVRVKKHGPPSAPHDERIRWLREQRFMRESGLNEDIAGTLADFILGIVMNLPLSLLTIGGSGSGRVGFRGSGGRSGGGGASGSW